MSMKVKSLLVIFYFFSIYIINKTNIPINEQFRNKIDYDNSLTNLACSIEKYFNITPKHKTLPFVDNLLNEKKPENVILLLVDGLGSKIIEKILNKNDYLIKNRKKDLFSVYPPTTAACLNSIKTGLNPSEHGWLGWTSYVEPIDKIIKLYYQVEKGKKKKDEDFLNIKDKYYFKKKTITELINEAGKYLAYETNCYPYNVDYDIDNVFNNILEKLKIKGKKYIFSTYPEPDEILHQYGENSSKSIKEIKKINSKIEEYSKLILENNNTMMFIVADHGHIIPKKVIDLRKRNRYNLLNKYLTKKEFFIESRSPMFKVKKGEEENFKNTFNKLYGKYFFLLSKEEILNYKLFGEFGINEKHELFDSSLGDFMAISKDSASACLLGNYDGNLYSYHGGNSDEEIYVPLIVISN